MNVFFSSIARLDRFTDGNALVCVTPAKGLNFSVFVFFFLFLFIKKRIEWKIRSRWCSFSLHFNNDPFYLRRWHPSWKFGLMNLMDVRSSCCVFRFYRNENRRKLHWLNLRLDRSVFCIKRVSIFPIFSALCILLAVHLLERKATVRSNVQKTDSAKKVSHRLWVPGAFIWSWWMNGCRLPRR